MPKIIAIDGIIGFDVTVEGIRQEIKDANGEDIKLEVSSPGGSVMAGLAIFNLVKNIPQNVTAHIIGLAGSMASIIPLAANKVIAEKTSIFFIHNANSFAFGDQNDLRKQANLLEGLSNLLGKILAEKSGKSDKEIRALMDEETFFIGGDKILENGFVDEVIQGQSTDTDEEALAFAQLQIQECNAKLKEAEPEDYDKIAAQLDIKNIQPTKPKATTQAAATQNPNKGKIMDLQQFLTENPTAQKELDSMIAKAETKATEKLQAKVDKVIPYIGNESYPGIESMCVKVLKNESEYATLDGVVAYTDMQNEKEKAALAAKETEENGDTPPEDNAGPADGIVSSEQDMDAIVAKHKKQKQG